MGIAVPVMVWAIWLERNKRIEGSCETNEEIWCRIQYNVAVWAENQNKL